MVKGIEAKSSYTQGEKFLHGLDKGEITEPVDFVPSNEDVYEYEDFGAELRE